MSTLLGFQHFVGGLAEKSCIAGVQRRASWEIQARKELLFPTQFLHGCDVRKCRETLQVKEVLGGSAADFVTEEVEQVFTHLTTDKKDFHGEVKPVTSHFADSKSHVVCCDRGTLANLPLVRVRSCPD